MGKNTEDLGEGKARLDAGKQGRATCSSMSRDTWVQPTNTFGCLFNSYLWGICFVPGPDLKSENSAENLKDEIPVFIFQQRKQIINK